MNEKELMNGEYYEPILFFRHRNRKMCLQRNINPSRMITASITDYAFVPSMYFIKHLCVKLTIQSFMAF